MHATQTLRATDLSRPSRRMMNSLRVFWPCSSTRCSSTYCIFFYCFIFIFFAFYFLKIERYLYLDNVMPREFGVAKHPLFFLNFLNLQRLMPSAPQDYSPINLSNQQSGEMGINEEVALEREKVFRSSPFSFSFLFFNLYSC